MENPTSYTAAHLTGIWHVVAFDGKEQSGKMKIEIQKRERERESPV